MFQSEKKFFLFYQFMAELMGPRLYSCCNCRNHVSLHDDIISKAFQVKLLFILSLFLLFLGDFVEPEFFMRILPILTFYICK